LFYFYNVRNAPKFTYSNVEIKKCMGRTWTPGLKVSRGEVTSNAGGGAYDPGKKKERRTGKWQR